jgi:hypothetical protein
MSMSTDDAASQIESIIRQLDRTGQRYNCSCQVGGVDAMSIDTDWILAALRRAKVAALRELTR